LQALGRAKPLDGARALAVGHQADGIVGMAQPDGAGAIHCHGRRQHHRQAREASVRAPFSFVQAKQAAAGKRGPQGARAVLMQRLRIESLHGRRHARHGAVARAVVEFLLVAQP